MKKLDPECFSIHYLIYKIFFIHESLCDLGPSINLIPLYLARKLKGVTLSPSTTTITLVDGSCKQSCRRINNALLRVGKLCFFFFVVVDFDVLTFEYGRRRWVSSDFETSFVSYFKSEIQYWVGKPKQRLGSHMRWSMNNQFYPMCLLTFMWITKLHFSLL